MATEHLDMDINTKVSICMLRIGNCLASFYFLFALISVALFSNTLSYAAKPMWVTYNFFFVIIAFVCGVIAIALLARFQNLKLYSVFSDKNMFRSRLLIFALVILVVQQWVIRQAWFITGWDAFGAVQEAIAPGYYTYAYSYYPNNLAIVGVFRLICWLFGQTSLDGAYLTIISVGGAIICASCTIVAFVAKQVTDSAFVGYTVFAVETLFIILSPQSMIPYTDAYGMLAPAILLGLCVSNLKVIKKIFFITFTAILGSYIKPNVIIVFIAIFIVGVLQSIRERRSGCELIKATLAILAAAVIATGAGNILKNYTIEGGTISNQELSMSPAHYLMMGWNSNTGGGYSQVDVDFSTSITSYNERVKNNLLVFKERINSMGAAGVLDMVLRKTLSNYSDGTGSWTIDGNYFQQVKGNNSFLISFYGIGNTTSSPYTCFAQLIWMFILCGVVLHCFSRSYDFASLVLRFSLLGQSLFLTIFECRSRYFIQFWPYFVIVSILGWRAFKIKAFSAKGGNIH